MSAASAAHIEPPKLARNLSFHFLWSSTFASGFADRLVMLSGMALLGYKVLEDDLPGRYLQDPSIVAGKDFWFFLPYVVWGPIAGWLADRLPRKWLMFVADQGRGLLILFAFFLLEDGGGPQPALYTEWFTVPLLGLQVDHIWKIWGLLFAIGVLAATFTPARTSVIPNVVGYAQLQRANAAVLGLGVIGNLIGFGIGGPLAERSLRWCILVSALCYMVSGLVWIFLKTPAKRHHLRDDIERRRSLRQSLHEIADGARYVIHHRPLLALTGAGVVFWGGTSIVMAAGAMITGSLAKFAYLGGGFGAGMLIGAIILSFLNTRVGGELLVVIGMIGAGICLILLVSVPGFILLIAMAVLTGVFGGILMVNINTMLQQFAPDLYRGRVFGFKEMASDFAKVCIAFTIWRLPRSEQWMIPLVYALALMLIGAAVWGVTRYVLRGPAPTRMLNLLWRIGRLYCFGMHKLKVNGASNVPSDGPVLIVANHTAGIDPFLIQAAMRRPVHYMMAREYMRWWLGFFWRAVQPIDVDREADASAALRRTIDMLRQGRIVGIFPEGGLNTGDRATMRPWRSGLSMIAKRGRATIVPVWIDGTPQCKTVFGSFFRPSHATVTFGRPFTIDSLDGAVTPADSAFGPHQNRDHLTDLIRRQVEAVRDQRFSDTASKGANGTRIA
ncbi:MAG: hypothetical protein CMJ49_10470 [Planctomycetaceae bacterium]|nr:hypothetical protein [Planctomycetaceae bacterium]